MNKKSDVETEIEARMSALYDSFPAVETAKLTDAERNPAADRAFRIILDDIQPTLIFDVGAHVGDGVLKLRRNGYAGQIVSFEPQPAVYKLLSNRAAADGNWARGQSWAGG